MTADSGRVESDLLHARVRAVIRAFEDRQHADDRPGRPIPETFDAIAAALASFQATRVPGYARLCAARGVDPRSIARASDAPAVPADAFKLSRVFAFDESLATATFRTSGTTIGARGVHSMRDVGTYDAAALAFGRAMVARGLEGTTMPVLILAPSDAEAPDSSLSHMCALFGRAFGDLRGGECGPGGERTFFVRAGELDIDALRRRVGALPGEVPAFVLATSFALVHLLDALGGHAADGLPLPRGSRVMQTGGYKGRAREVSAEELRRSVARLFAVDERSIVSEYGMTELSSQFWDATLVNPDARHGVYVEPPWARVVPVDPETLAPVPEGAIGIARIEDLANVDSAFAVLTQDRVRRVDRGFELLGRAPGAPPRGCSIAVDEMLGRPDPAA
jgi:hypothetical protein